MCVLFSAFYCALELLPAEIFSEFCDDVMGPRFRLPPLGFIAFRLSVEISRSSKFSLTPSFEEEEVVGIGATVPFRAWARACCVFDGFVRLIFVADRCGRGLRMFPTAFVRPSRKTMRCPVLMYSGCLINRNFTFALSPVRRQSLFMVMIDAV